VVNSVPLKLSNLDRAKSVFEHSNDFKQCRELQEDSDPFQKVASIKK
jgi:hypothetical protein